VEVIQSFSSQVLNGGHSPLVLVVSVRLGERKQSHLGAAWSGRSLPTCLRIWQARLAVQAREPHRRRQVVSEHCFDALIAAPLKKIPVKVKWPFGAGQSFSCRETLGFHQA
jgi:hypothetical protein